jgi:CSLREA domain-containing protein
VLGLVLASAPALGDIVVNTAADEDASNATCSLREAIIAVNTQADYNGCVDPGMTWSKVTFAIAPDTGEQHIISLGVNLPGITKPVFIDATTQSGTVCAPVPNLRVRVANAANVGVGLYLDSGSTGSKIRGLAMTNFSSTGGTGIWINSDQATIGCVISGMDATGTVARPNDYGIYVSAKFATIGEASATAWFPNLISGNGTGNIEIVFGADNALIAGNYIGVDHTGLSPETTAAYGIQVAGSGAHIGVGFADGPPVHQRNIIGSTSTGSSSEIDLESVSDTIISGNYIGVGVDGHTVLPIGGVSAGGGFGINNFQSTNTLIGCDGIGSWDDCRNVIAVPSNGTTVNDAIISERSTGTSIVGNYINVAANGVTSLAGTSQYTQGIELANDALVARNLIRAAAYGVDIILGSPNGTSPTSVFLNATPAGGAGGATLDSSDNCLDDTAASGVAIDAYMVTTSATTFANNWWGAINGPRPGGNGASADPAVTATPFLTAPSLYCGFDRIFSDGFDG